MSMRLGTTRREGGRKGAVEGKQAMPIRRVVLRKTRIWGICALAGRLIRLLVTYKLLCQRVRAMAPNQHFDFCKQAVVFVVLQDTISDQPGGHP
jgi:hypothetical protein